MLDALLILKLGCVQEPVEAEEKISNQRDQ